MKSLSVAVEMKVVEQCLPLVLFVMLCLNLWIKS